TGTPNQPAPAAATDASATPEPVAVPAPPAAAPTPVVAAPAEQAAPAKPETTASVPAGDKDAPAFTTAAAADTALVDKLREQLAAGKYDRILGGKKERQIVEQFYAGREFAPLWLTDGAISEHGKQ